MKNCSKSQEVEALRKVQQILKSYLEAGQSYLSETFEPDAFDRMAQNVEQDFPILNGLNVSQRIHELGQELIRAQAECNERKALNAAMKEEVEILRERHCSHDKFRDTILLTAMQNGYDEIMSHYPETDRISMKLRLGIALEEREVETVRSLFKESCLLP